LLYETSRNSLEGSTSMAFRNAVKIMDIQGELGINVERNWQRSILGQHWLVEFANYFYGSLWVVGTVVALIWLYHARPDAYPRWRTTLMVATGVALLGFYVFPLMPPRLLDSLGHGKHYGFVDTLRRWPPFWAITADRAQGISNRFAAMPSMHCGWALWVTCAVAPRVRHLWIKIAVLLFTPMTVWVVVVTGNHYLLDAVGGYLAVGFGYTVAVLVSPPPLPRRSDASVYASTLI
ncbi:MAG: phosphatase PAP2 family protein, partial [Acidimicrobiia bacterium]